MTSGMEGSIQYEAGLLLFAGSSPVLLSEFLFFCIFKNRLIDG